MLKTSPLTEWDRLQLLTKGFSDQQVRMVVELEGRLDEERLVDALRRAVDVEPLLACRVRRGFFRPRWERIPDFDAGSLLRIVRASDPGRAVDELLAEDLDPWQGPVVLVGLVRGGRDSLVVNLDHTAGDAASVRSLTYLLASLYGHPERGGAASPTTYFAKRGFHSLLRTASEDAPAKGVLAPPKGVPASWRFPWRAAAGPVPKRFSIRRLSPEQAAAVRDLAARQGAWLNDVLLSAYFRAMARLLGDGDFAARFTVPVDMRKYLPPIERPRIANFSAPFIASMGRDMGGSLEETLARVRAASAREKQGRPGVAQAAALSALVKRVPYRILEGRLARGKAPISLPPPWFIALGALRPECLSFGPVAPVDAYALPSVTRAGGVFQLSVSSFAASLRLAVCFAGDEAGADLVGRFLDLCEAELPGPA